jgi:hypothetical protein
MPATKVESQKYNIMSQLETVDFEIDEGLICRSLTSSGPSYKYLVDRWVQIGEEN